LKSYIVSTSMSEQSFCPRTSFCLPPASFSDQTITKRPWSFIEMSGQIA